MGAWGAAIFSDDTAADIRSEYRELLEDQVPDAEATARVIDGYRHLSPDQEHVLWLALAAAQHRLGRLEDEVRDRALRIIDQGVGLQLWEEAGERELAKRKAALSKLRDQLVGPQPARKTVRRPWRHVTDLTPGAVLAWTAPSRGVALFRVLRIDDTRVGAAPILERLQWNGVALPSRRRLEGLQARTRTRHYGPDTPDIQVVSRFRKKDPDWSDTGFEVIDTLHPRAGDAASAALFHTQWRGLESTLGRELSEPD
ncbi:hypothetical protein [Nocardioides sp. Root190]|uniref:hypothetical protein n=1 Tax=Nocardioides sp. Root190 TaxID=1736488 RepID=UPI0012FA4E8D|nr:hypothetical protein [Nocardioides sp. Root190]